MNEHENDTHPLKNNGIKTYSLEWRLSAPDSFELGIRQWEHFQQMCSEDIWNIHELIRRISSESVQWESNQWKAHRREPINSMNAAEALFGFMSWLSTRDVSVSIGARHDCAVLPELVQRFLATNKLPGVRENWHDKLTFPCDYMKK